jgi:hypothetical protein
VPVRVGRRLRRRQALTRRINADLCAKGGIRHTDADGDIDTRNRGRAMAQRGMGAVIGDP